MKDEERQAAALNNASEPATKLTSSQENKRRFDHYMHVFGIENDYATNYENSDFLGVITVWIIKKRLYSH